MRISDALRFSPVQERADRAMWDLATPALVIEASESSADVEALLRSKEDREHTSLVVHDPDTTQMGILNRQRFEQRMSGRFGFGRALFGRSPIAQFTDWHAAILPQAATLAAAVEAVLGRGADTRYDDVVLAGPGQWRCLAAGVVLEALAGRMAFHASRDDLTGLANRAAFFEHLQHLSTQARVATIAVIFIDLDQMKGVNDALGHNVGDALLVSVARRLVTASRPDDVVARLGGDEFAVALGLPALTPRSVTAALTQIAGRYLTALQDVDPDLDPRASSTASIGAAAAACANPEGTTVGFHTVLREADVAMYRAKQAGGDRVVVVGLVGAGLDLGPGRTAEVSIRQALALGGELEVYYQPILHLPSQRIASVEALIRWNHPTLGLLGPDQILAAAQAERALVDVDLWVLRSAVEQLLIWSERLGDRAPDWMNVNITNASVGDPLLSANILRVLAEAGCPPERLRLELPETASLALAISASSQLAALVHEGVSLTLDDMGAGASSLRHLSALAITEMKIDRSFVERMLDDTRDYAVVQMLINLGAGLRIQVTAEGIETPEQLASLKAMGVDNVQGYLLGRPAPADATEQLFIRAATSRDREHIT